MSLGLEVKSRTGMGIFLTMYSQTASTLYLSWAEMGMTGAPSAIVPDGETGNGINRRHTQISFSNSFSFPRQTEYFSCVNLNDSMLETICLDS